jgi:hypothetical protein
LKGVGLSAAICVFSSSQSSERLTASHGLGHESFGDILAAAWLGLLPSGQFLLGITNKGTEFAGIRPTVLQPPAAQSGKADVRSLRHFDFSQELCAHIWLNPHLLCSGTFRQIMFLQDACKPAFANSASTASANQLFFGM